MSAPWGRRGSAAPRLQDGCRPREPTLEGARGRAERLSTAASSLQREGAVDARSLRRQAGRGGGAAARQPQSGRRRAGPRAPTALCAGEGMGMTGRRLMCPPLAQGPDTPRGPGVGAAARGPGRAQQEGTRSGHLDASPRGPAALCRACTRISETTETRTSIITSGRLLRLPSAGTTTSPCHLPPPAHPHHPATGCRPPGSLP